MATTTTNPNALRVDLDYYPGHKHLFQQGAYQAVGTTNRVASYKINSEISRQDFLNYFLIHRSLSPQYATYAARLKNINQSIVWLQNAISMNNSTINALPGGVGVQERVGEAISLSISNVMFNLTQADWDVIPIQRGRAAHPTFDFERTWNGVNAAGNVIQIEAKGSLVPDSAASNQPNVMKHAGNITGKKVNIAKKGASYGHPASVRYGMIAAIDSGKTAKCWLLDPESDQMSNNPLDLKMSFRTEYVASMIELMAPQATLVEALRQRAHLWREGGSGKDSGPVRSARGFAFSRQNYVEEFLSTGKVWIPEHDIVGKVLQADSSSSFFVGLRGDVIRAAIGQVKAEVLESSFMPTSFTNVAINQLADSFGQVGTSRGSNVFTFHICSSGGVIGIVAGSE